MGAPVWCFKLLTVLLRLASVDAYLMSPLLLGGVACVLVAILDADLSSAAKIALAVVGGALIGAFPAMLRWVKTIPCVPDEDDVARASISAGNLPRAPVAPLAQDLVAKGRHFRDSKGRTVLIRGINCVGSCKTPTTQSRDFYDYKSVSFVGRPFPLEEADLHLARIRCWGYCFLRFLITWEAVEHQAPGVYDQAYLDYLVAVIRKCKAHGISVFLDVHQDVWSRWTGGDGAPAWTLEKLGFKLDALCASGAAVTEQELGIKNLPKMVWNSNNARIAAGTMWTLFFAGNEFAPATKVDGKPVQKYLQDRFCAMLSKVAEAVKDEDNVIGFDVLNEPSVGFVGTKDARDISDNQFYVGWRVDLWSAILLGAGYSRTVDYFQSFLTYGGRRTLNPDGVVAWKDGPESCVWQQNGVWKMGSSGQPELVRPDWFARKRDGSKIDFCQDFAVPFWKRAAAAVREHMPKATIFVEPVLDMSEPLGADQPKVDAATVGEGGFVWAKHWYDGITLMTQSFRKYLGLDTFSGMPVIGRQNCARKYGEGLRTFYDEASQIGQGGSPPLVGECGIPFNLDDGRSFQANDFAKCTLALDTTMRALEEAMISFTLWNYTPDNSNLAGDNWNGEDLSIFSNDQIITSGDEDNLHAGGRSLAAAVRPWPMRTAGTPLKIHFDPYDKRRTFVFTFQPDLSLKCQESIIYLPTYHYPHGVHVKVQYKNKSSNGKKVRNSQLPYFIDWAEQTLVYKHGQEDPQAPEQDCKVTITVTKRNPDETLRQTKSDVNNVSSFEMV